MNIMDYIDLKWFLLSFALGMLLVYCTSPGPSIIVKYPTPDNSNEMVYKDDVDNCYKFSTNEVACPKGKEIPDIPIQKTLEHFKKKKN